jgi:mannose-6-phosphate isomerase-like protein (cupin superfamily)
MSVPLCALALASLVTLPLTGQDVKYYPASQVDASFAAGATLVTVGNVKVMTATRTVAGEAERHATDTDIFHVLEGSATFVTGGAIVGAHETAPGETRGSAIEGGTPHQLAPGDVITIEAGVPHWYKSVTGRFRYYVVKVGKQ